LAPRFHKLATSGRLCAPCYDAALRNATRQSAPRLLCICVTLSFVQGVAAILQHAGVGCAETLVNDQPIPALLIASSEGSAGVVDLLLEANVDVNALGAGGHTALHIAAFNGPMSVRPLPMVTRPCTTRLWAVTVLSSRSSYKRAPP